MKVSELIELLKQYDPSEEVVIATKRWLPANYFHFVVEQHRGQFAKGKLTVVALEATDGVVGYFRPFSTK
jgi:hypothetical protein